MTKAEQLLILDQETFAASWFFAEVVQFGVFANIFMSQIGVV